MSTPSGVRCPAAHRVFGTSVLSPTSRVRLTPWIGLALVAVFALTPGVAQSQNGMTIGFLTGPNLGSYALGSQVRMDLGPYGGPPPYVVTALTPVPPGFILQENGVLIGIAQASGTFIFTAEAQNAFGDRSSKVFSISVAPFAVLSTSRLPDAQVGVAYNYLLSTTGTETPTWSLATGAALPPGISLSSGGLISGTPTASGSYGFNVFANSAAGASVQYFFAVTVTKLSITGPDILPTAQVGLPYSYQFQASNAAAPLSWAMLQQNNTSLTLDPATGVLSGIPTSSTVGLNVVDIQAFDGVERVHHFFTVPTISASATQLSFPPSPITLPDVTTLGQLYAYTLSSNGALSQYASGGTPPYSWSIAAGSNLPPGLTLVTGPDFGYTPGTTAIRGLPSTTGKYSFDLVLSDAKGQKLQRSFTLNVSSMTLLPVSLSTGFFNVAFMQKFVAVGGTPPYTYSISRSKSTYDALPSGMSLLPDGTLSGTPTSTGRYYFTVRANDSAGNWISRDFAWSVYNDTSHLQLVGTYDWHSYSVGRGLYQYLFTNSIVSTSYADHWSLVGGALPPGIEFSTDPLFWGAGHTVIAGQATSPGTYRYTLRATNPGDATNVADHTFGLEIAPMQIVASVPEAMPIAATATVGSPYSYTIRVAGGSAPYAFVVSQFGAMPAGLSLGPDGVISGTPTEAGNFTLLVDIVDASGARLTGTPISLLVTPAGAPALLMGSADSISDLSAGAADTARLGTQLQGGVPPYAWSVAAGSALPDGLALFSDANGAYLSGTPSAAGVYTFTLNVTDSAGQVLPLSYSATVSPLRVAPDAMPPAVVGVPFSVSLGVSGGTAPYSYVVLPYADCPPGLSLDSAGVLSGTPTYAGTFAVWLLISDAANNSTYRFYRMTVDNAAGEAPAISLVPSSVQIAVVHGKTSSEQPITIKTSSGSQPFTLSVLGVPGATLSATSGTATAAGVNSNLTISGTLVAGTYRGLVSVSAPGTANQFDAVPLLVNVTPQPRVTVVSPNGSESWAAGTTHTIQWTSADVTDNVNIALLKGGVGYKSIATNVPIAGGSYSWTVPATLPAGSDYTVRIMSATNSAIIDISNTTFSITAPASSVTVVSPNGGESWAMNTTHTIKWSSVGVVGNVNIALLKAGIGYKSLATNIPVATGSFAWALPTNLLVENDYTIRVMTTDGTLLDVSNTAFAITAPPPSITVVTPNGGENWAMGTTHTIQWNALSTTSNVNIALLKAGVGYKPLATNIPISPGSFSWTVPTDLQVAGDYTIRVMSVTDGTVLDVSNSAFSIAPPAASLTIVAPNGNESWAAGSTHTIQWNAAGVTGNVSLALLKGGVGYKSITASVPVSPGSYSWTLPTYLPAGSDYTIRVMTADGKLLDVSNSPFTITPGTNITVVSPNGSESWAVGSTHAIQWTSLGVSGNVNIALLKAGVGYKPIASNVPVTPGSFTWTLPANLPAASDYTVRVMSATDGTLIDVSNASFTITAP